MSGVALVVSVMAACGGHVDDRRKQPPDGGKVHPDAGVSNDASVHEPDATTAIPDAATPKADASIDAAADPSPDARVPDAAPPDADVCSSDGPLTIAGDYVAADKTQYWFRKSPTATTYTVVPGDGAPSPLPQLFRITSICPPSRWLSLAGTDGSVARLDWVNAADPLRVCVRSSKTSLDLEALLPPDTDNAATGCAGGPWLTLARTSP